MGRCSNERQPQQRQEFLQSLYKGKKLAKNYTKYRTRYPKEIYDEIMSYHKEVLTNGHQLALDICCGTGLSTLPLVPFFDKVVGVDVSEDLMEYLPRDVPNLTALVCPADNMTMIESGTVDLITVATSLHWLNIEKFEMEVLDEMPMEQFKGLLSSIHVVPMYDEAHPGNDELDKFGNSLKAIIAPDGDANQPISIKFYNTVFIVM